jgi:hypothetical protein
MKTHKSRYDFEKITSDDSVTSNECNTIEFENTGTADITIDDVALIIPGTSKTYGGRIEVVVNQEFEIVFSSTGEKSCTITKEFIE